tara:strand:- start:1981 stop:2565 length:585 start_codon:yes stop_codon:yes gene_type:complete
MKVFVYGTLKKGGKNHFFLKKSKFVRYETLKQHSIYDINHGFPLMFKTHDDAKVYGEIYEIDSDTLIKIDSLESEGRFYERVNDSKLDYEYYVTMDRDKFESNHYKLDRVKSGIWKTNLPRAYKVVIDDRIYDDYPDALVFHMRFFDGRRAPTNKIYMDLVKQRSKLDLNTKDEEAFIIDCILNGVIGERSRKQ